MKELLVEKLNLTDDSGRQRSYTYSVLIGEKNVGSFSCEDYGVKIAELNGESASIPDITVSAARIDELIGLLIRNTVTPTTLADVISDWL